jgi:hypothetical protein
MSDAVARNVRGNGEELRVVADDPRTETTSLMSSQQELEGDEEISGVIERRNTVLKYLGLFVLLYGSLFGWIFASSLTDPTLSWLLDATCSSVFWGTCLWMMWALIGRCRREPACRDAFIGILQMGLSMVVYFGGAILHVMFAMFAIGVFGDAEWSWTALVLLELQFVVNTCVFAIGQIYTKWLDSRPSIEGATGVCHLAPSLFAYCTLLFGMTGVMVPIVALCFWTASTPMPAFAWMAPVSMYACLWWQIELIKSSTEMDGAIVLLQKQFFFVLQYLFLCGSAFLHVMFALGALGAFGDADLDESYEWSWTALVLLELQFVVNTCVLSIGHIYTKWLNSRPSIEGATGVCHLAPSLFLAYCTVAFGMAGVMVPFFALCFWTMTSPMPAVAWMAPVSMLAVHIWLRKLAEDRLCACWMWISQRRSTNSVAAQFGLANSSMKKDGTDTFHDDRTETETTFSSEVV